MGSKHTQFFPVMFGIVFSFLLTCSNKNPVDNDNPPGPTGRVVQGAFLNINNNPIAGAMVQMVPIDYVPSISLRKTAMTICDTTDENGHYALPSPDSGTFNIEGKKDTLGVFIDSVIVPPHDTHCVNVPNKNLKRLGSISGISHMPGQNDTNQVRVTLYIPGTRRITKPAIGGSFMFDEVPEGRYTIIIDPTLNTYNVRVIDTSITAGETLNLDTVWLEVYQPDTLNIQTSVVWGDWGSGKCKIYRIYNDISVPRGQTLKIFPGTTVLFANFYQLQVQGNIDINGTPDSLIIIRHEFAQSKWVGLHIAPTDTLASLDISYCIFEHTKLGLGFSNVRKVTVRNCVFRYSNHVFNGPNYIIDSLLFVNNIVYKMTLQNDQSNPWAISFYQPLEKVIIENSIFAYNLEPTLKATNIDSITFLNNCFYNDSSNLVRVVVDSLGYSTETPYTPSPSTMTIFNDPKFTDTTTNNEDYHFQSSSPCKSSGINGTDMGIYSTYTP